jgi:predicted AAA+ superfamily ATPase
MIGCLVAEQLIKDLEPFRRFLEVAGQMNGKIINYRKIAQDVGVDAKTVKNYYQILEDTLLGFYVDAFHTSLRKRVNQKPKFFFFDLGVVHALTRTLSLNILPQTSYYGEVFEQFVIVEIFKLCQYFKSEYRLNYFQTKDGFEVDLIIERPGLPLLLIEIKSTMQVQESMLGSLRKIKAEIPEAEPVCLSQDTYSKEYDGIKVLPWQKGIVEYFR